MPPVAGTAITHREVSRLAWPMIVSNCSVPLLGIVDTALLGHLQSPVYLGAVAVGSSIMTFILWAFGFLRMGTTGQVAQAHGRNDSQLCSKLLAQSLLLAVSVAAGLMIFSPVIFNVGIFLMGPGLEIGELAAGYAYIRIASAPATLMTYVCIGWFIGIQRTREPLLITLCINGLNVLLDWLFIVGLGLNSNGAALATVLAEYGGLIIGFALLARCSAAPSLRQYFQLAVIKRLARSSGSLVKLHGHLFIRTLCLLFVFAFFTSQGARQGQVVLAANAILLQLLALVSYALDGYAHAAEALVGRTWGARDRPNFERACRFTAQWSLWTALGYTFVLAIGQQSIVALFTDLDSVRTAVHHYFPWLIALPLISFISYWLDGVFIGAGLTLAMRNAIVLACVFAYLPCWWLSQSQFLPGTSSHGLGNHGLWLAFVVFIATRGLIMTYYFRRFSKQGSPFV